MASPDLSAVVALCNKTFDLLHAGHFARAMEYKQRALAAAQARGEEDCLIVAALQLDVAKLLFDAALQHRGQRAVGAAPPVEPAIALFLDAVATLQRRSGTGTLLAGSCRAAEVMFEQLTTEHIAKVLHHCMKSGATTAKLVGYTTLLEAAGIAANLMRCADSGQMPATQEQLRICVALLADAAELIMQPRISEHVALTVEGHFMNMMQQLMTQPGRILPYGAHGARLLDSWQRLQQSGVLQRRRADEAMQVTLRRDAAVATAAAAAAAAPGLRSCALASCGAHEAHPSHFKSCAACRIPVYCCKEHQTEDWPAHKAACKAARKAAAEQNQAD